MLPKINPPSTRDFHAAAISGGLILSASGCSLSTNETLGLFALVGVAGLVALGVFFVFSLVLVVLNFVKPSLFSVVGAGVFSVAFFGSGAVLGGLMIADALRRPPMSERALVMGVVWLLTHVIYAAILAGSSFWGRAKRKRLP